MQAVVNLAQPITTPLFIIFIALCEAVTRKQKQLNKHKQDSLYTKLSCYFYAAFLRDVCLVAAFRFLFFVEIGAF